MDEATRAYWMSLRFSEGKIIKFEDEMQHVLRTLSFGSPDHQFDDMISTIHTRARMKYLLVGMESGYVFVFWVPGNRAKGIIRADKWINNLFLTHNEIFVSGRHRRIEAYSIHGLKPVFRLQANQNQEAYSSKGLMFSDLGWANRLIMNTGGVTFTILNAKTRKVLQIFSIPEHALKYPGEPNSSSPRVILNYAVQPKRAVLMFMLKDNPSLYVWDMRKQLLLKRLELYDSNYMISKRLHMLTILMGSSDVHLTVVIQFAKTTERTRRIKTVAYVVEIKEQVESDVFQTPSDADASKSVSKRDEMVRKWAKVGSSFHLELSSDLLDLGKLEATFIIMDVGPIMKESAPLGGTANVGLVLLVGDSHGCTYCMVIDTERKSAFTLVTDTFMQGEEVVGIAPNGEGAFKATYDGRVDSVRSFTYFKDPNINVHKGLLGE